MSGHGYELSDGYGQYSPPGARQQDTYDPMEPQQYQNYARSPPRKPVAPYARQPPGAPQPSYHGDGGSYAAYRPQQPTASDRGNYGVTAAGGAPFYDAHPSTSDMQQSSHGGDYYDPPSRDPFSDPYSTDSLPTQGQRSMRHQPTDSQSSLPQPPRHGSGPGGAGVGYGYGNDQSMPGGRQPYRGDGYDEYMDPRSIADDGDEAYDEPPRRPRSRFGIGAAAAGSGAAASGGAHVMKAFGARDPSGNYGPVGGSGGAAEKSEWLKGQRSGNKKLKWIVGIIIILLVLGGVAGGLAYYFINRNSDSGTQRGSASDDDGLWDLNSSQVQAVLNNKNLHKVFPGMDYTPLNAQYPDCLSNMPYQNDVTLDVAVLSQLSPAIRLYGTDCKQTEMVLKGIDLLGYNDTIKVWLGVYLDSNSTTNQRQLSQMYDILDNYPASHFAGVIVGNEVLFREDLTITQLADQLTKVRKALSAKGVTLPVATADLGDDWTAALAADSDIVMSNVHPFFAGKTPAEAPAWTLDFWNTHDVNLKTDSGGAWPANIISETGWPTQGGKDCGTEEKCTETSGIAIAGIDELNEFMDGWVCQRLQAKTTYFWFEAFDEPWKEIFNDPKTGDFWEPHWGLMDVNRNLKSGVKIPDCGGKTVDTPY